MSKLKVQIDKFTFWRDVGLVFGWIALVPYIFATSDSWLDSIPIGSPDTWYNDSCFKVGFPWLALAFRTLIFGIIGFLSCHLQELGISLELFYLVPAALPFVLVGLGFDYFHDGFFMLKFTMVWASMLVHYCYRKKITLPYHIERYGCLILWLPNIFMLPPFELQHIRDNPYVLFNIGANLANGVDLVIHLFYKDRITMDEKENDIIYIDEDNNIFEFPHMNSFFHATWFLSYWVVIMTFFLNHHNIGYLQIECFIGCLLGVARYRIAYFAQIRVANLYAWLIYTMFIMNTSTMCFWNEGENTVIMDSTKRSPEFTNFCNIMNCVAFAVNATILMVHVSIPQIGRAHV